MASTTRSAATVRAAALRLRDKTSDTALSIADKPDGVAAAQRHNGVESVQAPRQMALNELQSGTFSLDSGCGHH